MIEHPQITRRRADLIAKADRLQERIDALPEDSALADRLYDRLEAVELELDCLDMEAADPAAHGYDW